jgi:hypothetical protein
MSEDIQVDADFPKPTTPLEEPSSAPATATVTAPANLAELSDQSTVAADAIEGPSPRADAPVEAPSNEAATAAANASIGAPVPQSAPPTVMAPKVELQAEITDRPTPAKAPSSAAPTAGTTASPAASRSPSAIPAEIIQYAPPATRAILQALFRRPPIVAGQNIAEYFEIVRLLVDECAPISFEACFYIRTMADSLWKITTHQDVERCLFNAEVMDGLLQLEIDKAGEKGYNLGGDISLQRAYRVYFFRAVCGDERTKKELEEKFGFATVGLTAYTAKQTVLNIRAHAFVDGAIRVALGQYERAAKRLHELDDATHKQKTE